MRIVRRRRWCRCCDSCVRTARAHNRKVAFAAGLAFLLGVVVSISAWLFVVDPSWNGAPPPPAERPVAEPPVVLPPTHHSFSGSASPTVAVHIDRSGNGNGRVSVHVACLSTTEGVSRCRGFSMRDVVRQHILPRKISVVDYMQVDGMREKHVLDETTKWFGSRESQGVTIRALVADAGRHAHALSDGLKQHGYTCTPIPHLEVDANSGFASQDPSWLTLHDAAYQRAPSPSRPLQWSRDLPVLVDLVCLKAGGEGKNSAPQRGVAGPAASAAAEVDHIYVLTLQGVPNAAEHNNNRFDTFREAWTAVCGPGFMEHVSQCPGNVDPRRGFGVGRTFVQCMELALREGRADTAVFMEDDARPFAEVVRRPHVVGICNAAWRRRMLAEVPQDSLLTLLGGHDFMYDISGLPPARRRQWQPRTELDHAGVTAVEWVQSLWSEGLYGFAVRRRHLHFLAATFAHELSFGEFGASLTQASEPTLPDGCTDGKTAEEACVLVGPTLPAWPEHAWNTQRKPFRDMISPDLRFYARLRVYASNPLLVYHHSGQSNTWNRVRPDITGRHNYLTFSTPQRRPGHGDRSIPLCRLSDPLYNVTGAHVLAESETYVSLQQAQEACGRKRRCGGVMRTKSSDRGKRARVGYHLVPERIPRRNPDQESLRRKFDFGEAIPDDLPLTHCVDPFYPCLDYLETDEDLL